MPLFPALGLLLLMISSATEKLTWPLDNLEPQALRIVNTGIFAVTPDAMGITFYIDLVNKLPMSLDVATRMWECCETFDEGEVDCSHMHLMGGYKGIICPGQSRNVTLFYPNLYVYNRIGECLVGIWYRDPNGKVRELRTKISFDTTLSSRHVAPAIAVYYESETTKARRCAYIDEDSLDRCRPVDCSRKYNGQRLFYSNVDRRCLTAPKCNTASNITRKFDPSDKKTINLPSLVYAPEGNICEYTEPIIKEEDIRTLNSGRVVDQDLHPSNEFDFIVCHNGNKSLFTGRCTCQEGWSSTTSHIRPTTLKVHLCTVPRHDSTPSFDEAFEDIIYTVREIAPSFIDAVYGLSFYTLPASVFGSMALLGICLSAAFTCIYKNQSNDKYIGKINYCDKKPEETCRKDYEEMQNDISRDTDYSDSDITNNRIFTSDGQNFSPLRNQEFCDSINRSNICPKHLSYGPDPKKEPSKSVGFRTKTLSQYDPEDYYNASCSMTPQEKIQYLGQLKEETENESEPLLLDEWQDYRILRNDESTYTKPLRKIPKNSEASQVTNLWKNTMALNRNIEARKKHSKRPRNASSLSKSMAQLTYSPLPSSDSLLSLEETGTTFTPTTDDIH